MKRKTTVIIGSMLAIASGTLLASAAITNTNSQHQMVVKKSRQQVVGVSTPRLEGMIANRTMRRERTARALHGEEANRG